MDRDGILELAMESYAQMVKKREEELRKQEEEYQAALLLARQTSMRQELTRLMNKYPLTDLKSSFTDIQDLIVNLRQ